jgi:hypothetical protein
MLNVNSIGTNRNLFVIRLCLTVFFLCGIFNTAAISQVSSTTITREEALASLKTNRDRLLSTYALQNGYYDRSYAWSVMSPLKKECF